MRKKWLTLLSMFLCLSWIFVGCGPPNWPKAEDSESDGDKTQKEVWHGPSLSDNITWNSYGHFVLQKSGRDSTARKIIKEDGWHVYNDHNGGYGDTLKIASPNEEVVFSWSWNNFSSFSVVEGWTGKTERGAYIGIEADMFHELYPEFTIISEDKSVFYFLGNNYHLVRAYFEEGLLVEIYVYE